MAVEVHRTTPSNIGIVLQFPEPPNWFSEQGWFSGACECMHNNPLCLTTAANVLTLCADAVVYECACGFEASTAVAMHKHLSTQASSDAGQQHYLKSSFGLANPRQQQQQQQQPSHARISSASTRAAAASGSSTPNSLYGFTPVGPTSPGGDDAIAQAWEAVEQFYSSPNPPAAAATAQHQQRSSSRHQQQHYPSITGADPVHGSRSPKRQSQGDSHVNAAAAVQFAAGVSLNTGAHGSRQQQYSYIPDALPVSTAAQSSRDRTAQQQQQQQQEEGWAEQLGGVQGALGVQLMAGSGSIMAAMGGWVVNQAISAAATTATAALAGPAVPEPAARFTASQQSGKAAAAAAAMSPPAADQGGGSSSWWRRFSSRASESQTDAQPAAPAVAAAAGDTGAKKSSGIKGSLKAAAKRHGLRKKASVAAANAAAGGGVRGPSHDDDEDLSPGVRSEAGSGSEGFRSEGSAEYSQLLSQMDSELRDAAAAGAAAAVSGGTPGVTARRGLGKARVSAAAASAGGYSDITLDDDDSFMEDDVQMQTSGQSRGGSWLAAVGLGPRASSSSLNTSAAAAAAARAGSSGGGSYLWVDYETGSTLADRAKVLRGVLLWRSPGTSAKALGLGIYIIMLLGSIPRALHYMQVTTVLPGIALLYLTYNMAKPWTIKLYCTFISPASDAVRLQARLASAEEAAARAAVWFAARAAVEAGSWSLALLALAHRALRARRFTTSCWTFVALWLLLLFSELRVMNQTLLAMIAYAGLFCVPWLYKQFRSVIDKVVYDILHFMTLLLVNAERWAYALAVLAAALTWQLFEPADGARTGASLVVRCTASGIAGLGVLLWRLLVAE